MNLQELYDSKGHEYYPTDKGTDHSYLQIYSELFHPFQDKKINLIEIGICHGGGMRLFSEWFSQANIIGYDITDRYLTVPLGIRSRAIFKDLKTFVFNEFAFFPPHIIIDDATHFIEDQLKWLKFAIPNYKKGDYL